MSESDHHKPPPARPARGKPTPARELSGEAPPPPPAADVPEASLEVDGRAWTVKVLGRSGGASRRAPPLLLLGFWEGEGAGDPALEALVVGGSLSALSAQELQEALASATPPRDWDRKRPFFEDASQARRR